MTSAIIITFCSLLLIAYVFDLTSSKTKIPSAILLLLLGWTIRQIIDFSGIQLPNFAPILPVLGTVGLILIVLEGSLELELNRSKFKMISKSFFGALLPLFVSAFLLAYLFRHYGGGSFRDGLVNAVPFCIISSAIAIPSVRSLSSASKEFVIYESSLSDILGVLLFNFVALNESFGTYSFEVFALQLFIIIGVSFLATIALSYLLNKIEHHIKFVPIILLVILIYAVSKVYHLPALIFILLFGLFIGNIDELKRFKWIEKLKPDDLNREVQKFKELTGEATFLVRALFFLVFGYLLETSEILNPATLIWSIGVVAGIFVLRFIQLKISKLPLSPLLFIAPRGLITILLFLSIDSSQRIPLVNNSLIIQVIIFTALIMMAGLLTLKKEVLE
ncbi:sodium:proton antiporter [Sphingobacteriaceae bacterium]|nr:sodium:proton antiporter [Sphingobacteriaceae bacterium]